MGDLNINWDSKSDRKKLKHLADKYNLTQVIKGPTRITNKSKTTIDLVFSNKPERISRTFNLLSGLSDHNFILCSRKLKGQHRTAKTFISNHEFIPKSEHQNLDTELQLIDWVNVLGNDLEASSNNFIKNINKITTQFTKQGQFKKHRKKLPWLTDDVRKLMKERDNALKKSLKTGFTCDRQIFTSLRNKAVKKYVKLKLNSFVR